MHIFGCIERLFEQLFTLSQASKLDGDLVLVPVCRAPAGVMPPILTSAVNSRVLLPSRHAAPWDPLPGTVTIPLVVIALHLWTATPCAVEITGGLDFGERQGTGITKT